MTLNAFDPAENFLMRKINPNFIFVREHFQMILT
jgi:hypothetical protein